MCMCITITATIRNTARSKKEAIMTSEKNEQNDNQVDSKNSSLGKARVERTGKMNIHEQHEIKKPKAGGPSRADAYGRKGC